MSANVKTGVWITNEIYEKIQAGFLNYAAPGGDVDAIVDFTYWTWGGYNYGDAGNNCGGYFATTSPIQLPGSNWKCLSASADHSYHAIKSDGTLWGWGSGDTFPGPGNNSNLNRSSPVQIPGTAWNCIQAGGAIAAAIKTDGTLWVWGCNNAGRLGINGNINVGFSSPVQIPGTAWCSFEGGYSSLALKTDGTMWFMGGGAAGTGLNNIIDYSSPIQIPGTSWVEAFSGGMSIARKSDNTLWAWGTNIGDNGGNLGINSLACTYVSSPVQIPGTAWAEIYTSHNGQQTWARKTDNTLWAWGRGNIGGALGLNTTAGNSAVSSPAQIPGTSWCILTERNVDNGAGAIKSDGTMWVWGYSLYGRVPPGSSSSPVQIPGTSWWRLSGSNHATAHALKCP